MLIRAEQQQIFTQKMNLNLSVLQMNRVALDIFINKIADSNPLIDFTPKNSSTGFLEDIITQEKNLFEELREDLLLDIEKSDYPTLHLIIGNLTPAGFLESSISQISQGLDIDISRAEQIRTLIMNSSYLGLASYGSGEYLLFMASYHYGNDSLEYEIATALSRNTLNIKKLQKTYDPTKVEKALNNIKKFPPSPLSGGKEHYIYPDFVISVKDGQLIIQESPYSTPNIQVKDYQESQYTTKELKSFLKQTTALQKALQMREESLHKHATALILARSDFFLEGLDSQNVQLKDIAQITNRHISTVSRALKDRYFMFENEIYPFSALWNKKIGNSDSYTIKKIIKQLVDSETQPLTDGVITDILQKKGIKIARRTVNKYRKELQINSSYQRNL